MRARIDGAALRRARRALGLTQADLARRLGVAGPERISAWEHETNQPHVNQIPILAGVLKVTPESLLGGGVRNQLRDLRWRAGLTVDEVATQLHVGRNTYQRWETGNRAFPSGSDLITRLAAVLGESQATVRESVGGIGSANLLSRADSGSVGGVESRDSGGELIGEDEGLPGLAEKLNHLFATVPRSADSTRLHSNDSAAEALQESGIRVTGTHLSHLRAGRRGNPSARLLAGIAQLFGVPIAYFFDEDLEGEVNQQLATLVAMRDARVKNLMMRAQGVSAESLGQIEGILDQIRRLEGLEVADEAEGPAQ